MFMNVWCLWQCAKIETSIRSAHFPSNNAVCIYGHLCGGYSWQFTTDLKNLKYFTRANTPSYETMLVSVNISQLQDHGVTRCIFLDCWYILIFRRKISKTFRWCHLFSFGWVSVVGDWQLSRRQYYSCRRKYYKYDFVCTVHCLYASLKAHSNITNNCHYNIGTDNCLRCNILVFLLTTISITIVFQLTIVKLTTQKGFFGCLVGTQKKVMQMFLVTSTDNVSFSTNQQSELKVVFF